MGHLGGNRAPERSAAAAQGFNAVPGSVPWPLGQGFCPLRPGPTPHTALGHGDLTGANGLYDNSYGGGQQPAALPPSPTGYGAAYSQSDPCEPTDNYHRLHAVLAGCQTLSSPVCTTNAVVESAVGVTESALP